MELRNSGSVLLKITLLLDCNLNELTNILKFG